MDQCSPPEHNLLVSNTFVGILLTFIIWSFLLIALTNATKWYIKISTIITGGGKTQAGNKINYYSISWQMFPASILSLNTFYLYYFFFSMLLHKIAYSWSLTKLENFNNGYSLWHHYEITKHYLSFYYYFWPFPCVFDNHTVAFITSVTNSLPHEKTESESRL